MSMEERRATGERRRTPRDTPDRRESSGDVFYTVEELALRWKCQRRYVYKLIEARCLHATKLGPRLYRIRVEDLASYEERNRLTS